MVQNLLAKHATKIGVGYDEDSLAERQELIRGLATVDQDETIYFVSRAVLKIERKPRLKFPGTTAGGRVMPVSVPPHADLWHGKFLTNKKGNLWAGACGRWRKA